MRSSSTRTALVACALLAAPLATGTAPMAAAAPSSQHGADEPADAALEPLPDALEALGQVKRADLRGLHVALDAVVQAAAGAEPGSAAWPAAGLFRALRESSISMNREERTLLLDASDELVTVAPSNEDAARSAALFARLAEPRAGGGLT